MSDIIRRGKTVPVQARRAQPQPDMIEVPGAGPVPVPPHQPGVTQNIIYVNVTGQPQPAPPPSTAAEPSEIHVHNHIHQYPKRSRGGRYGTSFLGTLGFVLGGVACGACFVPQLVWLARFIAIAAVGCSALGLLGSLVVRKNSAGMPLFGLLVSAFGYWLWMMKSGQAQLQLPKAIQDAIPPSVMPTPTVPAPGSTPAQVPLTPGAPAVTVPPADPGHLHDPSLFGDGGRWGNGSNPSQTTPPQATPQTIPPTAVTPSVPTLLDPATAQKNLDSARMIAARKMGVDYATVKTTAADAKTEYDQARATETPGSPALQFAGQTYLNAASRLTQVEKQLSADPAVAAAEAALKTAKPK